MSWAESLLMVFSMASFIHNSSLWCEWWICHFSLSKVQKIVNGKFQLIVVLPNMLSVLFLLSLTKGWSQSNLICCYSSCCCWDFAPQRRVKPFLQLVIRCSLLEIIKWKEQLQRWLLALAGTVSFTGSFEAVLNRFGSFYGPGRAELSRTKPADEIWAAQGCSREH